MSEIFISYASEERDRAQRLAHVLGERGWSVWWDRKIPLGKSFDEVIEKALAEAKCVIVLWSATSAASDWVRNEASEAKRREILVPVFIEAVDAPLAFRLLNGANLIDWQQGSANQEFDKLIERVTELVGQGTASASPVSAKDTHERAGESSKDFVAKFFKSRLVRGGFATAFVVVLGVGYMLNSPDPTPNIESVSTPSPNPIAAAKPATPGGADMEKAIKDLSGLLGGGAIPATSLAKGFHVPGLGVRIAYLTAEQSASTLGALPAGAAVLEVEGGRPAAKAGLQVGDVILAIGGKKIASENDLRQAIFKLGPGKTKYSYRRAGAIEALVIDCPSCQTE